MSAGQVIALVVMWVVVAVIVGAIIAGIVFFVIDRVRGVRRSNGENDDLVHTGSDRDALLGLLNHSSQTRGY